MPADRPGFGDVAVPLAAHIGQDGRALERRLVDVEPGRFGQQHQRLDEEVAHHEAATGCLDRAADPLVAQDAVAPQRRVCDPLQADLVEA